MSPSKVDNSGNIGVSVFWEQRWAVARKWTTTKLDTLLDTFMFFDLDTKKSEIKTISLLTNQAKCSYAETQTISCTIK